MKKDGFLIARDRRTEQFFTSTSSYDRPQWKSLSEATVYLTADLAQAAAIKLARHGVYTARVVPLKEAMELELPPQDDDQVEDPMTVDVQPDGEGGMEMVASVQSDQPEDDPEGEASEDDIEADISSELENRMQAKMEAATMPAKPPLDAAPSENKNTALDVKGAEEIKFNNPANKSDKPDTDLTNSGANRHDEKVRVPAEVMSDLKNAIEDFNKCAELSSTRDDAKASFCMTVAGAFSELQAALEQGTTEGVKRAQVLMTSWMNPITSHLPVSVQKFIYMGGRKPTLKDMFDAKREQLKKGQELIESVHPDIAKKQRAIDRLMASGCGKDHPDVQKLKREIERLKQATKGS